MDVDDLAGHVETAAALLQQCRAKLTNAETAVKATLSRLDGKDESAAAVVELTAANPGVPAGVGGRDLEDLEDLDPFQDE